MCAKCETQLMLLACDCDTTQDPRPTNGYDTVNIKIHLSSVNQKSEIGTFSDLNFRHRIIDTDHAPAARAFQYLGLTHNSHSKYHHLEFTQADKPFFDIVLSTRLQPKFNKPQPAIPIKKLCYVVAQNWHKEPTFDRCQLSLLCSGSTIKQPAIDRIHLHWPITNYVSAKS